MVGWRSRGGRAGETAPPRPALPRHPAPALGAVGGRGGGGGLNPRLAALPPKNPPGAGGPRTRQCPTLKSAILASPQPPRGGFVASACEARFQPPASSPALPA